MKKADYHIHADFSSDSQIRLAELIPRAIELGYSDIAVTEHLDLSPQELSRFGIPPLIEYKNLVSKLQKQYKQINIYCGIEVGDFQDVKVFADQVLKQMKFDPVLGSVHYIRGNLNVAVPIKYQLTSDDILNYYEHNLYLVENCDIDILTHLGVYKRYMVNSPDEMHCLPVIRRIFEVMINKGTALELNLSCLRKAYNVLIPESHYLELYRQMGGKLVTIGSDAHALEQFDEHYEVALSAIQQFGFRHLEIDR